MKIQILLKHNKDIYVVNTIHILQLIYTHTLYTAVFLLIMSTWGYLFYFHDFAGSNE